MTRVTGWPTLLVDHFKSWSEVQFEWGKTDCCQFVRSTAEVLTGRDFGSIFPTYESEFGAARVLAEYGGMQALLTAAFGEPKTVAFAQRGDVVMCDFGRGLQPSICDGIYCLAPSETGGITARPTLSGIAAWSI